MKPTLAKDLVVGAIYSDTDRINDHTSFLKYIGVDERGDPLFVYVGGNGCYIPEHEDGSFSLSGAMDYMPLSPSEIEQYLPKTD